MLQIAENMKMLDNLEILKMRRRLETKQKKNPKKNPYNKRTERQTFPILSFG